jgi:hypothetical protein
MYSFCFAGEEQEDPRTSTMMNNKRNTPADAWPHTRRLGRSSTFNNPSFCRVLCCDLLGDVLGQIFPARGIFDAIPSIFS